mmetsp:Transcript_41971/g.111820  ORF Transcript_41971/g.111820 Transcript_41971/m.111820 type:complete len:454 (-) Transcript_41971:335-1696(-)|eukprot:CAMPEP_0119519670 /NCGR_PEP_ID=MMETSP1344-20130328/35893_1 /TAXON_ID=236787 /ORGANISM="Florenciella parvula, Strain CCMP2471" /LENGTH=453 /DNA_ID=CAMNT_0007557469 /DNA_START=237 /DNA_END=1598 /DNA_ORIENTATION=+
MSTTPKSAKKADQRKTKAALMASQNSKTPNFVLKIQGELGALDEYKAGGRLKNQRATWDTAPREPDEYVPYRPRRRRSAAGLTFKETLRKEIATTTANRIRASLKAEAEQSSAAEAEQALAMLPNMGQKIGKKADKEIKERRKSMKMERRRASQSMQELMDKAKDGAAEQAEFDGKLPNVSGARRPSDAEITGVSAGFLRGNDKEYNLDDTLDEHGMPVQLDDDGNPIVNQRATWDASNPRRSRGSFVGRFLKRASFGMIDIDFDPDFTEGAATVVPKKGVKRKDMIKAAMVIQRNWKEYKKARVAEKWLYLIKLDKHENQRKERDRAKALEKRQGRKQKKMEEAQRVAVRVAIEHGAYDPAAKYEARHTFKDRERAQIVALNMNLGFPQTEEQWEVYYDHFVQKPKLAVRREMNRMKETNEILDLDLLDKLKEHELKELLPDRNNKATIPGL